MLTRNQIQSDLIANPQFLTIVQAVIFNGQRVSIGEVIDWAHANWAEFADMAGIEEESEPTEAAITLNYNDQVKTSSDRYETVFTVGSVEGYSQSGSETPEEALKRSIGFGHPLAWVNASGACLTADYEGKADDRRRASEAYRDATLINSGDHVTVEGRQYTVQVLDRHESYSDGIKLVPLANHPYVN